MALLKDVLMPRTRKQPKTTPPTSGMGISEEWQAGFEAGVRMAVMRIREALDSGAPCLGEDSEDLRKACRDVVVLRQRTIRTLPKT